MRRFSDPVEVRSAGPGEEPEAFIWRGRLYVVRDVLDRWRERRAWWRDAPPEAADVLTGTAAGLGGTRSPALAAAAREQQLWRVEASPGWSFAPGVYDLARDESTGTAQWLLVRVAD